MSRLSNPNRKQLKLLKSNYILSVFDENTGRTKNLYYVTESGARKAGNKYEGKGFQCFLFEKTSYKHEQLRMSFDPEY